MKVFKNVVAGAVLALGVSLAGCSQPTTGGTGSPSPVEVEQGTASRVPAPTLAETPGAAGTGAPSPAANQVGAFKLIQRGSPDTVEGNLSVTSASVVSSGFVATGPDISLVGVCSFSEGWKAGGTIHLDRTMPFSKEVISSIRLRQGKEPVEIGMGSLVVEKVTPIKGGHLVEGSCNMVPYELGSGQNPFNGTFSLRMTTVP